MDKFKSLIVNLEKHISLTKHEERLIAARLQYAEFKKREMLLEPGAIATNKFFIIKGSLRQYFVDDAGVEHTTIFGLEGWWMSDIGSFVRELEARFFIEAMEDSEVLYITKKDLDVLFDEVPKLNVFFRKLYQNAVLAKDERILNMLSSRAEDRFFQFLAKYPDLENRIPQYYIASYLGVTPEFFSRMKSRLSNVESKK